MHRYGSPIRISTANTITASAHPCCSVHERCAATHRARGCRSLRLSDGHGQECSISGDHADKRMVARRECSMFGDISGDNAGDNAAHVCD